MSLSADYRPLTSRIGTHYAVFVSAFGSLVLLLLILEQLGARKLWLSHVIIVVPVLLYLGIAAATRTIDANEFFTANRRVPALFGGLSLAITSFGGIGLFSLTGALYLIGFDALGLAIGWCAGLIVGAILLAPYLRKAGAYTVAGFLRLRYGEPLIGAVASVLLLIPTALLLAAELKLGAFVASLFAAAAFEAVLAIGAVVIVALAALGGMRSLTWTQCTQYTVALAGYVVPLIVISVLATNLPLPQLTYGSLFERLGLQELAVGITVSDPMPLATALSSDRLQAATTNFTRAFSAVSRGDFIMLMLCFLAGTAAMPTLLMRAGTASSVFETRRAAAWGLLFLGILLITAPAYAAFAKYIVLSEIAATSPSRLPAWIGPLRDAGLADFADRNADGVIGAAELAVHRDGVTLALPIMGEFPFILAALVAAAGVAATLAAATAHANAIGTSISDDIACGFLDPEATPGRKLLVARLGILGATAVAAWTVAASNFDVLHMACWAMSLAASTFLAPVALSIWWSRTSAWGSLAGMLAGFTAAAAHIGLAALGGGEALFGLSGLLAAAVGVPVSLAATVAVSVLTPPPPEALDPTLEQLRDPSGPAIQDTMGRSSAHDAA